MSNGIVSIGIGRVFGRGTAAALATCEGSREAAKRWDDRVPIN